MMILLLASDEASFSPAPTSSWMVVLTCGSLMC